jgi:hypothetical protein
MDNPPPIDPALLADLIATTRAIQKSVLTANQIGNSRRPYYTETWAKEVADILTAVATTGEPKLLPKGDYDITTIKNRWYQGKDYLLEHLDPDKLYAGYNKCVSASIDRKRGVFIAPFKRTNSLGAIKIEPWKPRFEEFLETAVDGQMFERIGTGLCADDYTYLEDMLSPLADMFVWHCDIDHDILKVVRITQATAEELLK